MFKIGDKLGGQADSADQSAQSVEPTGTEAVANPAGVAADCIVMVNTWPKGYVRPELTTWLLANAGVKPGSILYYNNTEPSFCAAMNAACEMGLKAAETLGVNWIVFAEGDMMPTPATLPFWEDVEGDDIVCCEYDTHAGLEWSESEFHTGLWRIRPEDLQAVPAPRFRPTWNKDYTQQLMCPCEAFRQSFISRGLKGRVAAKTGHDLNAVQRAK
jgi:hypothetical protein